MLKDMFSCFKPIQYTAVDDLRDDCKNGDDNTDCIDAPPPEYTTISSPTASPFRVESTAGWSLLPLVAGAARSSGSTWNEMPQRPTVKGHVEKPGDEAGNRYTFTVARRADRLKKMHVTFNIPSHASTTYERKAPELLIKTLKLSISTDPERTLIDWNGEALLAHNVVENELSYCDEMRTSFCVPVMPFHQMRKPSEQYIPLVGFPDLHLSVTIDFHVPMTGVQLILDGLVDESTTRNKVASSAITRWPDARTYHMWIGHPQPLWHVHKSLDATSSRTVECDLDDFDTSGGCPYWTEWVLVYSPTAIKTLCVVVNGGQTLSTEISGLYSATVLFHKTFERDNPLPRNLYVVPIERGLRFQRLESIKLVLESYEVITEPVTVFMRMGGDTPPTSLHFQHPSWIS